MAKVKWAAGIDYVSGLLGSRPKAGNPHSTHSSVLLATHRVAATENPDCDLMQQATDISNFLAQKDTPGGKKTMRAYLWKVCGDAYDAALAGA